MKTLPILMLSIALTGMISCASPESTNNETAAQAANDEPGRGQSGVVDDVSNPNIVQVAVSSKDHTTLVAAVKAAELVDVLSNAGPFTVFAPTNEAFNALPAGTVDDLMRPEKKDALTDILQYHVSVAVYKAENLMDGQTLGQVNGGNIKITKKGDEIYINGNSKIIASIPASNGIIHVVDHVLLPQ